MGLLKDIYDVIASQPAAKKMIDEAVLGLLKGGGIFATKPTRAQRKANLKSLVPQLTKDDFSSNFEDLLAFFGALLGLIVETAYAAERGCLVSKLFLPGYHFYFPVASTEPSLKKLTLKSPKHEFRALANSDGTLN